MPSKARVMGEQRVRRWRGGALGVCALIAAMAGGPVGVASGQVGLDPIDAPPAQRTDGPAFLVGSFVLAYSEPHPQHPLLAEIMETVIELGVAQDGLVRARADTPIVRFRLSDVPLRPLEQYHASAIISLSEQIVEEFNRRGVIGVQVMVDPGDIDGISLDTLVDLREPEQTSLRIEIWTGVVTQVTTQARGQRIKDDSARINNPAHSWVREQSPIQPYDPVSGDDRADLLRRDSVDRYVSWLNRHPGRRVDVSVGAGEHPGESQLDYLITENKPWTVYGQVSNTGTEATSEWRERVGYINYQTSGRDDILSLDFITSNLDETNALIGSYEAPLFGRLRARAYANWNEYTASDVGFADEKFKGEGWSVAGELVANVYQQQDWFADVAAGVRYQYVKVNNEAVDVKGDANFVLPYLSGRVERITGLGTTTANLTLEAGTTSTSGPELDTLGRLSADDTWTTVRLDVSHSMYLEPIINGSAWRDPSTPESSTLAHELYFALRGQYAFDNRLIPQAEMTMGGMYTVRGYRESAVAGDSGLVFNAEYRYHLPRVFGIEPEPRTLWGRPFRLAPQQVYGRPDWDLILKGFFDYGSAQITDNFSFEDDETLMSVGAGVEASLYRNVNLRVEWGLALSDAVNKTITSGSSEVHVLARVLY